MNKIFALLAALAVFLFFSCEKDSPPPPSTGPAFKITVNNDFGLLENRIAAYLSNADGKVLVYREIPGSDSAQLEVANAQTGDRFDCTIVKIVTIDAPGSGVKDTSISLKTYTNLGSGETVNLRDLIYGQTTDLNVTFTNLASLDSIIVPDGLTFVKPQPSNNFTGQYHVLHTGQFWLRVRVNGEQTWRFIIFKNINNATLTTAIDASQMLPILATPTLLTLPFTAAWQYKVDGLIDTNALKFLALGDLLRAPGGAIPVFTDVKIYEPISNDAPNNPEPKPYNGFRLQVSGSDEHTYFNDRFYADLPTSLPLPAFDLLPTVLSDNRLVATQCVGNFDALVFARSRTGTPNIIWEVYIAPSSGIVAYRLPDVPTELGNQFPALKNYDFGGQVRARAESYDKLSNYEAVVRQRLLNNDPIWQAKAGYLGREEEQ